MKFTSLFDPEIYNCSYWPVITYHYAKTWSAFVQPMHWHQSVEIMYVFMGHCSVFVQDQCGCEYETQMRSGDFVLLNANSVHRLYVEPDTFCYMLNVEFAFEQSDDAMFTLKNVIKTSSAFAQMVSQPKTTLHGNDVSGELYRAMHMLQTSYLRVRAQKTTKCVFDAEMAVFLIQLAQALKTRQELKGVSVHVRRAINYIENNFDTPLTVEEIAAHVGVHAGHLQRTFKSIMDMTIVQYITRLRIDKATALLENADQLGIGVDDVSMMVGFQSRQHFSQCFKRLTMISPNEYRKNHHRVERIQYTLDAVAVPHITVDNPDISVLERSGDMSVNISSDGK